MTNCDAQNRRVLEGSESGMVEKLLQYLPGGTEERQETNLLGQHMYWSIFEVNTYRIET
jgi:hypothetical protein